MSKNNKKYFVQPSKIHGSGTFANKTLHKNEDIDVGIDFYFYVIPYVTPEFGSLINHSFNPNCHLKYKDDKWFVTASKNIPKGHEILLDYRKTPWYILGPEPHYK